MVVEAGLVQDGDEVPAADPSWRPGSSPAGQHGVTAGEVELLGELDAGLPAPDHQGPTWRQLVRVAVLRGVEDHHRVGQPRHGPRSVRLLVGTGADHDGLCVQRTLARLQVQERVPPRPDACHPDALANLPGGIPLEVVDDLVACDVPLRVVTGVRRARQVQRPVRGHQREAVPAVSPCLRDPACLEHDVLDPDQAQLAADRQTRLPRSDNDDGHPHIQRPVADALQ